MRRIPSLFALSVLAACGAAPAPTPTVPTTASAATAATPTPCPDADAGAGPPACGRGDARGPGGGPGAGPVHACTLGSGPLPPAAKASVERALAEERTAELVYEADLSTLGDVPPFKHVARAERRHSSALERLLAAHGHPIPPPEKRAVAGPKDLAEACRAGVDAEKRNIAFYDAELATKLPADVACVYEHLQHASRDHHLPAFERCR